MDTVALVWLRRDLRVHDHPPLHAALAQADRVLPVFCLDERLLAGRLPSARRVRALLASLAELREALRARGGELVVRRGPPERELPALARETGAAQVHFASDVSPFAMRRDARVEAALATAGVQACRAPGNFIANVGRPRDRGGDPFTVFTPFWRAHRGLERRAVLPAPERIPVPEPLPDPGAIPDPAEVGALGDPMDDPVAVGESAARDRLAAWLASDELARYHRRPPDMARPTSRLSVALHLGTVSAREIEARAAELEGRGPASFLRQLTWRDFHAHVLLHHPGNAHGPLQERMAALRWSGTDEGFATWAEGRTGYPIVDAGMRELNATGFMHNRARLICASFLIKDLHVDWQRGEAHFMRQLLDGDVAQNNGNWQWIASVGVDPAPFQRRLYNPMLQQARHDPTGAYVRRWVPELARVPDEHLAAPWELDRAAQRALGCEIGRDYPAPVVDHAAERKVAIEAYQAAIR